MNWIDVKVELPKTSVLFPGCYMSEDIMCCDQDGNIWFVNYYREDETKEGHFATYEDWRGDKVEDVTHWICEKDIPRPNKRSA